MFDFCFLRRYGLDMKTKVFKRLRGRPRIDVESTVTEVIHMRVGGSLLSQINKEWHRRGLPTRVETVRALLMEALEK
jgi:hypothetical protein